MTKEEAACLADQCAFSHLGFFRADRLVFLKEVRDMCAVNSCGKYNRCWSCPPACGTLDEIRSRIRDYEWGILGQSTARLEDEFDGETMMETGELHKKRFEQFCGMLAKDKALLFFPMGAGACTICEACTWPGAPCRFPERMVSSMEACGLVVSDVCRLADTPYYYGPLTLTYTSCVLFGEERPCENMQYDIQ